MATSKSKSDAEYIAEKDRILLEKVMSLETENGQLRVELATTKAKLDVYERLVSISDSKTTLGFCMPMN